MAVEAKISRDMGNGYVQVDLSTKNSDPSYYIMPQNKVNSFVNQYKKDRKNNAILGYGTMFSSVFLGAFAMSKLLNRLKTNGIVKLLLNLCGTVGFSMFSMHLCDNYIQAKRDELMQKHHAKQIFYDA